MNWRVVLEQDRGTGDWAVWCPELPGCTSAGETQNEALEGIKIPMKMMASTRLYSSWK